MSNKIIQATIAGIIATIVFSIVVIIAPGIGLPKMNPPGMVSMMLGVPMFVGWLWHFMIGIIFAISYALLFINLLSKVSSNILKGVIFGFAAFVFAQIMLAIMGLMLPMPPMDGSMMMNMIGSIIGHIIFGITVALMVEAPVAEKSFA